MVPLFHPYLSRRSQAVYINGTVSSHVTLHFRVLQGSVFGPILFTIYSSPIANIARKYGLCVHAYADDTQLYLPFDLNDPNDHDEMSASQRAEACIFKLEIKSWMTVNKQQLNDEKTEFLIMTSKFYQHKIHDHQIKVDTAPIPALESARNLGIIFVKNLCMEDQIRRICESVSHKEYKQY